MMWIAIIFTIIVGILAISYFFYSRQKDVTASISKLTSRFDAFESKMTRTPNVELESVFGRKSKNIPCALSKISDEDDSESNYIVEQELERISEEEKKSI